MNVSLTPQLEQFVKNLVESGMYGNASEVVRAGLRVLKEHDEAYQRKLERLRAEIQVGDDSGVAEDFRFDDLRVKLRARAKAR